MKITKIAIRNFKRFREEAFDLDGDVVIAGPNDSGKTTLLQAISCWSSMLSRWLEANDFRKYRGTYAKAVVTRQAFCSMPLRAFALMWSDRKSGRAKSIELDVTTDRGRVCIEIVRRSDEHVHVRPSKDASAKLLRDAKDFPQAAFVPAIGGLEHHEPVYKKPKVEQLLGRGKSGDVLRNILAEISYDEDAWGRLANSVRAMFDYELLPPDDSGADIIAEYQDRPGGPRFDLDGAGSGFLQVLLLLAFLISRRNTVFLLDEPDAHLHVILQDTIYGELRRIARESHSQLIIATHSDAIINAIEPRGLLTMPGHPRKLADDHCVLR